VDLRATMKNARMDEFVRDMAKTHVGDYDIVINDFEPITAWAAKRIGKRSLGISHQAAFRHAIPRAGQDLSSRVIMRMFAPTTEHLGVHWYHFGFPILPPIIEVDHMAPIPPEPGKILVYLPFESLTDIRRLLSVFTEQRFFIYHPDAQDSDEGNLQWRALSRTRFGEDLADSEGVIANGGFELPSESLFLGKKLLVKPLRGQFEQESNVATLAELNLAHTMPRLDIKTVENWLEAGPAKPLRFPNVAHALAGWLGDDARQPLAEFCAELWQRVEFPSYMRLP
jgi:uncharacterized protein (TIGR00661 family)